MIKNYKKFGDFTSNYPMSLIMYPMIYFCNILKLIGLSYVAHETHDFSKIAKYFFTAQFSMPSPKYPPYIYTHIYMGVMGLMGYYIDKSMTYPWDRKSYSWDSMG